jgi:hypothetical protein
VERKVRVKMSPQIVKDLYVLRGRIITPDQFDDFFENANEVYSFFDGEIILGAVVSEHEKRVYIVSALSATHDAIYAHLTIFAFDIE